MAVTATVAVLVYAAMWIGWVRSWAWLTAVDDWFLDGLHAAGAANPAWVTCWNVFCTVLGPTAFRLVGVGVIIWLLVRRHLRAALFLVISVELSGLVTTAAKLLANRARPSSAMVYAFGSSFPSGHALSVMVAVLALLTVILPLLTPRWRSALVVIGAAIVVLIGFGRVALNVHHPSDVVAGWALGYLWYLVCLLAVRPPPVTAASERPAVPGNSS
jgi:membrane-associated phospholipid phosphatase